jgi:hypothetical protein
MPNGYGLHIGLSRVSSLHHGGMEPAPGCDVAAARMRAAAEELGYRHTTLLIDQAATKAAFTESMRALASVLAPGDILLLTLAGHGVKHVDSGDPDERRDQAFLLFDHVLVDDALYDLLEKIPVAARVIIVAEACYSGSIATVVASPLSAGGAPRPRTALLPNLSSFPGQAAGFTEHADTFPGGGRAKISANVLLLAAAAETAPAPASVDPEAPPPFTTALLSELGAATSYRDLHQRLTRLASGTSPFAQPVLNDNLVNDPLLLDERPFSI